MKILIANWKMNLSSVAAAKLASELAAFSKNLLAAEVWIAPAFTAIPALQQILSKSTIRLGAQNAHWEKSGAFTGEISTEMLAELGVSFALIGHSERRHIFGETDELVTKRALGILPVLKTVFCIGETLADREQGRTNAVLEKQLRIFLTELDPALHNNIIFAYEPVWAIGTGKIPALVEIQAAHSYISSLWQQQHHRLPTPPILYGGSITPENFADICSIDGVAGGLVGGASLDFNKFSKIISAAEISRSKNYSTRTS